MEEQARKEERKRNKQETPGIVKTEGEKYSAGVKVVETVVFVPTTPNSNLRKLLQKADDQLCLSVNSPSVRFVERGGPTLMDTVGRNNPVQGTIVNLAREGGSLEPRKLKTL